MYKDRTCDNNIRGGGWSHKGADFFFTIEDKLVSKQTTLL